ncbi:hypothetical protein KVG29_05240 [Caldicoprobacter algeriensis]|uniref:hypothetical protein n=1 Tax=Caldicoprobacter algeriensis TaxID=699281 RepID=UPI00207A3EC9|nr:hypothetical protein [Caldicoprobacter algeriensis]MCM8900633.1 hypothetical protein [Caldicoprobacter algeriensis]
MNRFKLEAFKQEFPFLNEILEGEPTDIKIKRADENLLKATPEEYYWDGSKGYTKTKEAVYFILKDGTILQDAVKPSYESGSNYAHSQHRYDEGETVLEAIYRLQQQFSADDIQYIVWVRDHLSDWDGSEYEDYYYVTIYKTPKGTSYSDIIHKAEQEALQQVKAEADF